MSPAAESPSSQRVAIVSADCHAGPETVADYAPYVPEQHRQAFDDYCRAVEAYDAALQLAWAPQETGAEGEARGGAISHRDDSGLWDMGERQRALEADGVAAEVIFTQGSVPFAPYPAVSGYTQMDWKASREQLLAGPEIYNRWLADLCSADPELHYGVAALPIRDLDTAVAEVARARESGLRGGVALPPMSDDCDFPLYNDRIYDRLWAACQDHEMVINLHGGARMFYGQGPETTALILSETDFFSRRALWFLIFSGVFERFPRLRLALTEQRAHWVAPLMEELDSVYRAPICTEVRKHLPRLPSEIFASHCYVGASFMSRPECELRHRTGPDRLMWGSDYPHMEGAWPWVNESLRWTFDGVGEEELRGMLGGNAMRCYGFDAERVARKAAAVGPELGALAEPLERPPQAPGVERSWAFRSRIWN